MAHLALYREWRPKTFDEVVEQKHAVHALKQSVISGQIAHAYLFSGTRGTGKTTLAKIFSRAINCLQPQQGNPCNSCEICRAALDGSLMDIIEMDAASNNSVDNIRRICDEIVFMPSQARFKVYIVDEVHMLSAGAFNALLKTLEEPPAHAVFILATTESHRIPATILSRCQRYEFRRIPVASMVERLQQIARDDSIAIQPEALRTIATLADGALRDAISLLDQARGAFPPPISHDQILSLVGVVQDQFLQQMATALLFGRVDILLQLIDQLIMAGRDLTRFVTDLAQHLRNLLVCQMTTDDTLLVRVNSEALTDMKKLAGQTDSARLIALIRGLSALLSDLRWAPDGRTALEIGLIRLTDKPSIQEQAADTDTDRSVGASSPASPVEKTPQQQRAQQQPQRRMHEASTVRKPPEEDDTPLPEPPPEEETTVDHLDPELPAKPREAVQPTQIEETSLSREATAVQPEATAMKEETAADPIASDTGDTGSTPDVGQVWQQMLDQLQEQGHMTLYLFSRPAKVSLCEGTLQMAFAAEDTVHYQEINQPRSLKIIRDSIRACSGQDWPLQPLLLQAGQMPACPDNEAPDWVERVRQAASNLGIPVQVEE